jgi:hypothetical protein
MPENYEVDIVLIRTCVVDMQPAPTGQLKISFYDHPPVDFDCRWNLAAFVPMKKDAPSSIAVLNSRTDSLTPHFTGSPLVWDVRRPPAGGDLSALGQGRRGASRSAKPIKHRLRVRGGDQEERGAQNSQSDYKATEVSVAQVKTASARSRIRIGFAGERAKQGGGNSHRCFRHHFFFSRL